MAAGTPPPPTLVLVPAQLPLGLFMELLNSMSAMAILHQFLQWSRGWQVAPVVLVLPLLPCRHRMVPHRLRGRAASTWSARRLGAWVARLTLKSARTPTT